MSRFNNPDKNLDDVLQAKQQLKEELERGELSFFAILYTQSSLKKARRQLRGNKEHLALLNNTGINPRVTESMCELLGIPIDSDEIAEGTKIAIQRDKVEQTKIINALENSILVFEQMQDMINEFVEVNA